MKKLCPFGDKKRCTVDCEWFDKDRDTCSFLVIKEDLCKFTKLIYDYVHTDMEIKRSKTDA
jgi:hypothetical protein